MQRDEADPALTLLSCKDEYCILVLQTKKGTIITNGTILIKEIVITYTTITINKTVITHTTIITILLYLYFIKYIPAWQHKRSNKGVKKILLY